MCVYQGGDFSTITFSSVIEITYICLDIFVPDLFLMPNMKTNYYSTFVSGSSALWVQ